MATSSASAIPRTWRPKARSAGLPHQRHQPAAAQDPRPLPHLHRPRPRRPRCPGSRGGPAPGAAGCGHRRRRTRRARAPAGPRDRTRRAPPAGGRGAGRAAATRAATGRSPPRTPRRRARRPSFPAPMPAPMPWVAPRRPLSVEPSNRSSATPGARQAPDGLAAGVQGVHAEDGRLGRQPHEDEAVRTRRRPARRAPRWPGSARSRSPRPAARATSTRSSATGPMSSVTTAATSGRHRLGRPGGQATRATMAPSRATHATRTRGGSPVTDAATMSGASAAARRWGTGWPSAASAIDRSADRRSSVRPGR